MFIEQLDNNRILICIDRKELLLFWEDPENANFHNLYSQRLFSGFIYLIAAHTGMILFNKQISIKYLRGEFVSFLILSFSQQHFLPKGDEHIVAFSPENLYNLISAVCSLTEQLLSNINDSSLFFNDRSYILILRVSEPHTAEIQSYFSEFGSVSKISSFYRYSELFVDIIPSNAVHILSEKITASPKR